MPWESCIRNGDIATLKCIPVAITQVSNWLFGIAAISAVFFIIFAGIKFLSSGGDPVRVEGARKTLTYAVIGLVLVIMSFFIVKLVGNVLDAECLDKFNLVDCQ